MDTHGAKHMGKLMPKEMAEIGTKMHHAASRFAITSHDAAVDGGLEKAFGALSEVMQQCVACHAAYKIHEYQSTYEYKTNHFYFKLLYSHAVG